MAAVPAPDGRPARPGWQAIGLGVAYFVTCAVIGFGLGMLIVTAAAR